MDNHALIDWLSFSLPRSYNWQEFAPLLTDLFQLDSRWIQPEIGKANWYRYRHTINTPSGRPLLHIYTEPTASQNANTTAVSVTGYALCNKPDALQGLDPVRLIRQITDHGGKLTRLDLALDDFSGKPILAQMIEASAPDIWRDRVITGLCRNSKPVALWDETLYFGHLSKGSSICSYDKSKQQATNFPWFRCEFRTKDRDLLQVIQEQIVTGVPIGKITAGLLSKYLRFVPTGRLTKYNRETCRWWSDFLQAADGYELTRHSAGKIDDEPRKAPTLPAFGRYLREALKLDDSGQLTKYLVDLVQELQLEF